MATPENNVLSVIYNCGGITKRGISDIVGGDSSDSILKDLLSKRVIKKKPVDIKEKKIALYTFTDAGERYFTELTGKKHFYRCSNEEKIVAFSYFYIAENVALDDWKNKDEWYAEGQEGSIPDGTYTKGGKSYGIVITRDPEKKRVFEKFKPFSTQNDIDQIKIMVLQRKDVDAVPPNKKMKTS